MIIDNIKENVKLVGYIFKKFKSNQAWKLRSCLMGLQIIISLFQRVLYTHNLLVQTREILFSFSYLENPIVKICERRVR